MIAAQVELISPAGGGLVAVVAFLMGWVYRVASRMQHLATQRDAQAWEQLEEENARLRADLHHKDEQLAEANRLVDRYAEMYRRAAAGLPPEGDPDG